MLIISFPCQKNNYKFVNIIKYQEQRKQQSYGRAIGKTYCHQDAATGRFRRTQFHGGSRPLARKKILGIVCVILGEFHGSGLGVLGQF